MKGKNLTQKQCKDRQAKQTNKDRQKLCKIRSDKKARKLTDRAKKAAKEIMNECEETLVTTNEVIYAVAYVITEKLNGKPKNYNNRRKHKQPLWKSKTEK